MISKFDLAVPSNYRTHDFHLFDRNLKIGGMARPNYGNQNTERTLEQLQHINPNIVLIGLYKKYDFSSEAEVARLPYLFIPITDYQITPPETYDQIYAAVKQATSDGRQVIIHCGAGNGRTGAALAALKLRELLESAAKIDSSILDEDPDPVAENILLSEILEDCPCSPLVKQAVESIRLNRQTLDDSDNGSESIESASDVASLISYEKHLRTLIKQELEEDTKEHRSGFSL